MNAWKMTNFLIELQLNEEIGLNMMISPKDVPWFFRLQFLCYFPLQFFCYFFDYVIVSNSVIILVRARLMVIMELLGGALMKLTTICFFFFLGFSGVLY